MCKFRGDLLTDSLCALLLLLLNKMVEIDCLEKSTVVKHKPFPSGQLMTENSVLT